MPVPISPPMSVAAVPERTFDQWLYTDFHASDITLTGGTLSFSKVPMNSQTGDTYPEGAVGVSVPFWEAKSQVPEADAAFEAVMAALPAIEAWKNEQL